MPENDTAFGKIIAKAWRDPSFKAALIANPAAALKAEAIDVPDGITVTVLENTDKHFHLVLPPVPSGDLSEDDLEAVAAGKGGPPSSSRYSDLPGWLRAFFHTLQPPVRR